MTETASGPPDGGPPLALARIRGEAGALAVKGRSPSPRRGERSATLRDIDAEVPATLREDAYEVDPRNTARTDERDDGFELDSSRVGRTVAVVPLQTDEDCPRRAAERST